MKSKIKTLSIIIMTLFYIMAGTNHFINPDWYVRIVPPILPFKTAIIYISGILEIILGTLLIFPKTRFIASWGLILLLVAVYPPIYNVLLLIGKEWEQHHL